ncbi:beta-1,3-galactosyltransferase 1-like [Clytia hemisphaerica]|uniref:Hexosyltransferase n=1 Tax=Clytia hemisphaerica TaxID=252671 RepID=A0A7M5UXI6_9CNID
MVKYMMLAMTFMVGFIMTAFMTVNLNLFITGAGNSNPTKHVYIHNNKQNEERQNLSRHFEKFETYLKEIRKEMTSVKEGVYGMKAWEKIQIDRMELWKTLDEKSPPKADLRNPHIVLDDVKLDCSTRYDLIILISSHAAHFERREKIRRTWGNASMWITQNKKWKVVFVLGVIDNKNTMLKIKKESKTHGDVILEDVPESFYQLSFKVMVGLHWAFFALKFDFVLKGDDDVFVHVDRVLAKLDGDFRNEHYIGSVMSGQPVERKGRYGLTAEEHKNDRFDPYCSGGGFILSNVAISRMISLFDWLTPLKIDDAYIGHLVFRSGYKAKSVRGFYMWNNWCEYNEHLMVTHPVKQDRCLRFLEQRALIENGMMVDKQNLTSQLYGLPSSKKT